MAFMMILFKQLGFVYFTCFTLWPGESKWSPSHPAAWAQLRSL
jgi:hypothetical protein